LLGPIMTENEEMKKIFSPNGQLLKSGETYKMKKLANVLEILASEGEKFFYYEAAKKIAADCQKKGGHLTEEDFKSYQVIERTPLKIDYKNYQILTNTPPSAGGILIVFALKLLEKYNFQNTTQKNYEYLHKLILAMEITNIARKQKYDNKIYDKDIVEEFLGENNISNYQNKFTDYVNKWGSTTHISVVDKNGNAASMTTTNGEGSGYVVPDTEIMINNMLGEEDLNPYGFHKWKPNRRIASMMSPTIALNQNKKVILGSGGSNRIRTAILQTIINVIDFKMDIASAIESPRVHWEDKVLNIEPGFPKETIKKLHIFTQNKKDKIINWTNKNLFFGGVHGVSYCKEEIKGHGDQRRSGVSLSV